ncbi:MAG: aldehyde dehydrogenase family protein [Actinomycetes bacterium]
MSEVLDASPVTASVVIGGEAMDGADGVYDVHNPARPAEVVGRAPVASNEQLDAAVAAARRTAPGWAAVSLSERAAAIAAAGQAAATALADLDLATSYTREHGKVRTEAQFELDTAPIIGQLLGGMAETALTPSFITPGAAYPRVQREPYGVAALILPFNWPVAVAMTKLGPALAAGNTTVVKVPPSCPLTVLRVLAEFAAALPRGVVNVLSGPSPELGRRLVAHPGIDLVSFTGGTSTGRAVMAAAAENLTPVLLELGGNDAAVIAPDLPITETLADLLAAAAYTTTGQVCMAAKRIYAPRGRVAELVDALRARCDREVIGDGLAPEVTLGPLHTPAGYHRVADMIDDAGSRGATVVTAGRWREEDRDGGGYFILPTIVTDVAPDAPVVAEEQFGPVLPVLAYDDIDQAVEAANATPFGLTASVWTADDALADRVATALVAGTVGINCHGMAAQDPRLPFGGFRTSGIGRELGPDGIQAFTQTRSFVRHDPP